jgi:ATP-dependent DNA helicase RecG
MIENQHAEFKTGRNFLIADVFYKAGQIENWGRGTIRMIEECEKEGLPKPHFAVNKTLFTVSFENENFNVVTNSGTNSDTNHTDEKWILSDIQQIILRIMADNERTTAEELSSMIGLNLRNTKNHIAKLKKMGFLERIGNNRTGYWKVKD